MKTRSTLQFLFVMLIIVILSIMMTSCNPSKSEKVVVISCDPCNSHADYNYKIKVKRIEKRVVDYALIKDKYEPGDTIYLFFNN